MTTPIYHLDALFAGVGGLESGFAPFKNIQIDYANEFDHFAQQTYALNYPNIPLDKRDIHQVQPNEIPDCDILIGGFPCQAFSIGGNRQGFADPRGTLFFEMLRLIQAKQPQVIMFENVKNLISHDHGRTFKVIVDNLVANHYAVKWQVMNSKAYGNIPQNRERIYLVGFKQLTAYQTFQFPKPIPLKTTLRDVIDFQHPVADKYYYTSQFKFYHDLKTQMTNPHHIYQWRRHYLRENQSGVVPTLTASMGTGGHNVPLILTDDHRIRKLTPRETFNLQGYPQTFQLPPQLSNAQRYKQAGNSVTIPVIKRIAKQIIPVLTPTHHQLNPSSYHYHLMKMTLTTPTSGQSRIIKSFKTQPELKQYLINQHLTLTQPNDYLKLRQKKHLPPMYFQLTS